MAHFDLFLYQKLWGIGRTIVTCPDIISGTKLGLFRSSPLPPLPSPPPPLR